MSLEDATPNRRGRRRRDQGPVLEQERLASTLLEIVRVRGVTGLQMRTVAKTLGVSPKVLYNHVADKQGMLEILVETILRQSLPDVSAMDWEDTLRAMADALNNAYKPYPGLLEEILAQGGAVLQHDYTRWFHATAQSALAKAGVAPDAIYRLFVRFAVLVMGSVLYAESNARSTIPAETDEDLDQYFHDNVEMFLRDVRQVAAARSAT